MPTLRPQTLRPQTLREVLTSGKPTVGGWCAIPSGFSAELMGRSGLDWVCVDTQHGLIGYDAMVPMLQALAITGTPAIVRVPWNQPDHIMKALDAGAQGVVVPMINNADDARRAVAATRYPPDGTRSWGPIRAALDDPGYSPEPVNRRIVLAAMIETSEGVRNMDEILSVPGVDACYIGPSDLALGHGMTPTLAVADPEHEKLVLDVLAACKRHGVIPGIHCDGVTNVRRWHKAGFTMTTLGSDAALLRQAIGAARREIFGDTESGSEVAPQGTAGNYA
ncbi:MAG: 2,4-dihydroxyhept-2-ene-1,7-dioic acid aldolase [Streptosporangiales bacterium]|nr:2,4-dihydroxyhept-2-ene-1,7-dioic acid aldolase [Streptosporangiales bacterium]